MTEDINRSTEERRRHPRYCIKMEIQFELGDPKTGKQVIPARTTNLSIAGLAMLSAHEFLEFDQKIVVHLFIPPKEKRKQKYFAMPQHADEAQSVFLKGRVVWCHVFGTSKYIAGVEFEDYIEDNRKLLGEFLEEAKEMG
jgi:Tfp pilus assembly protein PilZ